MAFRPVLIQVSSVSIVKQSIVLYYPARNNNNNKNNKNKLHEHVFLILYYLVSG